MPLAESIPEWNESPFACPACRVGLGLPRQAAPASADLPVSLRCHRCGHEWDVDRAAVRRRTAIPAAPADRTAATLVQPIAVCRGCAGLITLDVWIEPGRATRASEYRCPHCGAPGEVALPGAVVRAVAPGLPAAVAF